MVASAEALQAPNRFEEVTSLLRELVAGTAPVRAAFALRAVRAITTLAREMDEKDVADAVAAPADLDVVLSALGSEAALAPLARADPLARARLRGIEERRRLLSAEGGSIGAQEVARLLHVSRQAVHKRQRAGRLLGVDCGRHGLAFPVWQFGPEGVIPGLEEVLDALQGWEPWSQLAFLLSESDALGGETPLEALRQGDMAAVLRAARTLGEQGPV